MRITLAVLFLALFSAAATAQSVSGIVRLDLLPGWREADGTRMAGLRITLSPGWKTYWRAPGEAGIPPSFDWSGSGNLAAARAHFPVPDVFDLNGIRTIGYQGSVVLPIALSPKDQTEAISLRGRVALGVCETICVPFSARIEANLPADVTGGASEIRSALADTPLSAREAGVRRVACVVEPISDGLRLTASMEMPALGQREAAVIELPDPTIWVSEAESRRRGGTLTATADLVPAYGAPFALDRSSVLLTVLADGRAVEMKGCGAR